MIEDRARRAIERLLKNGFNESDMQSVFLFIRDKKRHGGRKTIRDVGDLIAHAEERTMGALYDTAKDCATIMYFAARCMATGVGIDDRKLDPDFFEVMEATARQLDEKTLHEKTRMKRNQILQYLGQLKRSFYHNEDGTFRISTNPTEKYKDVVKCLTSYMISKPAYNDDKLFDELSSALRSQGILKQEEAGQFSSLKPAITLFAISKMHNVEIKVGINSVRNAILSFTNNIDDGGMRMPDGQYVVKTSRLGVDVEFVDLPTSAGPGGQMALAAFATKLSADEYCEASLLRPNGIYRGDIGVKLQPSGPKLYLIE